MVLDGLIRAMRQKSHCQLRLSCCSMIYVICSYNVNGSQLTYSGVIMCTVSKGVKRSSGWFEHQQPDGMSVHVLLRFHFSKKRSLAPQPRSHTHNTLVLSHIDTKQYFFFFTSDNSSNQKNVKLLIYLLKQKCIYLALYV